MFKFFSFFCFLLTFFVFYYILLIIISFQQPLSKFLLSIKGLLFRLSLVFCVSWLSVFIFLYMPLLLFPFVS